MLLFCLLFDAHVDPRGATALSVDDVMCETVTESVHIVTCSFRSSFSVYKLVYISVDPTEEIGCHSIAEVTLSSDSIHIEQS